MDSFLSVVPGKPVQTLSHNLNRTQLDSKPLMFFSLTDGHRGSISSGYYNVQMLRIFHISNPRLDFPSHFAKYL